MAKRKKQKKQKKATSDVQAKEERDTKDQAKAPLQQGENDKRQELDLYQTNTLLSVLEQEVEDEFVVGRSYIPSSAWPGSEALIAQLKEAIVRESERIATNDYPDKSQMHTNKVRNMQVVLDWISGEEGKLPRAGYILWAFEGRVKTERNFEFWKRWWPAGRGMEVCAIGGKMEYHASLRQLEVRRGDGPQDPNEEVEERLRRMPVIRSLTGTFVDEDLWPLGG